MTSVTGYAYSKGVSSVATGYRSATYEQRKSSSLSFCQHLMPFPHIDVELRT